MRQWLSALSYFSIFFAPFLFPIIIWAISSDAYTRRHSLRALVSHLFPFIAAIPLLYSIFSIGSAGSILGYLILFALFYFGAFVYNVVQGVRVLAEE
ncbi:DUF4870 domain-containing protein [Paenibacillus caui]|uniref:DUF4870 domain-containing protein n=1 Tax=Paenibacillus caui TaxID=2873927 RepID=UPI001CA83392|nr:DUF4870 domain-containing protein [Paenibacillus caui]